MTFTLAHFSDPHVGPLPKPRLGELLGKRFFGYLSWLRKRRALHRPEVLAALAADLQAMGPDHVAITGDLGNISLLAEFELVGRWLAQLGAPDWITVVPGNHDAYVAVPWDRSIGLWRDYMSCAAAGRPPRGPDDFPILRVRDKISILGLTSAHPTPLFLASGSLGTAQLRRLEAHLVDEGRKGSFRVVLLHHPPHRKIATWRKCLTDADDFRGVIARGGAELILHGHDHNFSSTRIATPNGTVPVIGVPSASAAFEHGKPQAHYNLYRIEEGPSGWQIKVTTRAFDPQSRRFNEDQSYAIEVGT